MRSGTVLKPEPIADAGTLHAESIVIDACSFFLKGYGERQQHGGVTAIQITAAYPYDTFENATLRIAEYFTLVRRDSRLELVGDADHILRLKAEGRVGIILTLQSANPIGDKLSLADVLHRLGVRVIQLTYNERNLVGDGCYEPSDAGLSLFGRALIEQLNALGILIDLSHAGERTSLEAIERSERPCIFSHSNPRALFPNPRNITDQQMKAVAAARGLVGISSWPPLCWDGGEGRPSFSHMLRAIDYAVELVGPDAVAIGTDSVATAGAYPPDLSRRLREAYPLISGRYYQQFASLPENNELDGFDGMADFPKLTSALLQRGYPPADVRKILGENLLRVYREAWGG